MAVLPAADIPRVAKTYGATVVEIDLEKTPLTRQVSDYVILGPCTTAVPEIVKRVKAQKE
jgi:NAD-dependent deacetylase